MPSGEAAAAFLDLIGEGERTVGRGGSDGLAGVLGRPRPRPGLGGFNCFHLMVGLGMGFVVDDEGVVSGLYFSSASPKVVGEVGNSSSSSSSSSFLIAASFACAI